MELGGKKKILSHEKKPCKMKAALIDKGERQEEGHVLAERETGRRKGR